MRIAIGGFQHETNTFAPSPATYDDFAKGGGWPGLASGPGLFEAVAGINLPVAGFIGEARALGHELVATTWAAATPSAQVTRDAYERIAGMIVEGVRAAGRLDGIYLCLHGAMVAEHQDDGEGELLERLRAVVGPDVPIVASLDLHANVTGRMVRLSDALVAYRTYPHVDMAETGRRAARHLDRLLRGAPAPHRSVARIPFLIPLSWQCTTIEPARSLYALLEDLEGGDVPTLSFATGFPAADFPECGPVVVAYGRTAEAAERACRTLADAVEAAEADFAGPILDPDVGVREAMAMAERASKPVVIADTQDNPGAGGNSDTTGMLRALVANGARRAAIGILCDPEAALAAHAAGEGAEIDLALGGRSGIPGDAPFAGRFAVERVSDGRFDCTGPFYHGARMALGPSACLRIGGVRIVVASAKVQLADQEMYRFVGIEPTEQAILVNKSSVHFRADFEPIAEAVLICAAPGPMIADPAALPWRRLAPGIRLRPCGPAFAPAAPR